jgi:hypothetical protein
MKEHLAKDVSFERMHEFIVSPPFSSDRVQKDFLWPKHHPQSLESVSGAPF